MNTIRFEKFKIKGANFGEMSCLPDIKNDDYIRATLTVLPEVTPEESKYMGKGMIPTLLPYQIQSGYDRSREMLEFDAAILENEYLKATFVTELGGRLWSLYDKKAGRELLYANDVFQPGNLALRNAWFSGGVEWNVGIKGHNPLTCSPLFAEELQDTAGNPMLRMYEFERIRGIAYSIEAKLEKDVLLIRPTIENTAEESVYMYWWSNIAVDETPDTRVIVPCTKTFKCAYEEGNYFLGNTDIPVSDGIDITYATNLNRSRDFFYKIPENEKKWITAVDKEGYGLIQMSTNELVGRKLFAWGEGAGGKHWNNWLSDCGKKYIEIQAGLMKTQLEHFLMEGKTAISWTEGYGAFKGEGKILHGDNFIDAINEGADNLFWQRAIRLICSDYNKFENIKFIFTFRENESDVDTKDWYPIKLKGFEDKVKQAIDKYFGYYEIDVSSNLIQKYYKEFNEPLFLSIFCQVFQHHRFIDEERLTYSMIFRLYIYFRNSVISEKIDEDPHLNITYKYLDKLANYSLYYNHCLDVPRDKARQYANQLCRNRKWSESLLYWTLRENLLFETQQDEDSVMFGFQKMGDFLIADVFKRNKMSDEDKIHSIIEWSKQSSYRRFISALLSDWDLTPKLLTKKIDSISSLIPLILDSLKNHGINQPTIIKWLEDSGIVSVHVLHDYFDELPIDYFEKIHNVLLGMKLTYRDTIWTNKVNELYLSYNPEVFDKYIDLKLNTEEDKRKYLILLCWLSTSSHPSIRHSVIRQLVILFEKHKDLMELAITRYCECNDPYVMQVITCAIYGCLLRGRKKGMANNIASIIRDNLYANGNAPNDILIRQWSLLIFQYTDYLNNNNNFTNRIKTTFNSCNPYKLIIDNDIEDNNKYFGESNGSWRMHKTLYGFSDFKRYILGTNSRTESNIFCQIDNNETIKAIPIEDIQTIIANIVKHQLGWNDELGKLDNNIFSQGRYNNKTERFGKKYLWLALYQLDAMMCDNFKMVDGSRYHFRIEYDNIVETPYPWYTNEYSHIDPSIINKNETFPLGDLSIPNFMDVNNISNDKWLDKNQPIDNPRLILGNNNEWIVLSCYDGYEIKNGEYKKDFYLFTNAAFVKNEDLNVYNDWAREQNFYGRWMPERRNGNIEHLWKEYPWSDTYKRTITDDCIEEQPSGDCPVHIHLSYESQLQEEWTFLNENNIGLREAQAPNHHMMSHLGLYTAERGIIRDSINPRKIVAINFQIDKFRGLAIDRSYLERYLNETGFSMIYYTLGEKCLRANNYQNIGISYDLSGAFYYNSGEIKVVQPMHIIDTHPKES